VSQLILLRLRSLKPHISLFQTTINSQTKVLLFKILFHKFSSTRSDQINNNTTDLLTTISAKITKTVFKMKCLLKISKVITNFLNKISSRDNFSLNIDQKGHVVLPRPSSVYKIHKKAEVMPDMKSTLKAARKFTKI
jgi:hypothetical protein